MFNWLVSSLNLNVHNVSQLKSKDWQRRKREHRPSWRPVVQSLEDRCVPTCALPWCVDTEFDSDGHSEVNTTDSLEEARATHLQTVLNEEEEPEQRILIGGTGANCRSMTTAPVTIMHSRGSVPTGTSMTAHR